MQDVMYGRLDNFPSGYVSINNTADNNFNNNTPEEDENEDDGVTIVCCVSKNALDNVSGEKLNEKSLCEEATGLQCSFILRLLLIFFVAIVLFIIVYNALPSSSPPNPFVEQSETSPINSSRANTLLTTVCDAVVSSHRTGDACDWLCHRPRNYTITGFYEGGSKIVLKLNRDGKDLILKTHHISLQEFDTVDSRVDDEEFTNKVLEIVNEQLRMDWPFRYKHYLMRLLWPGYSQYRILSNAERQSLWALMQQDEFIEMKVLSQTRVTPKVLGSCAHLYQVEYMIPFKMKAYYMNLKAKILLHLMGTLKLFYEFLNEPLQWCDVKFENLGLSAEYPRRFMVLDSDMLYTDSKLNELLTTQRCQVDAECNHFDCHSSCNNATGFCTPRTNDNVDVFCEKLVNRLFGSFWSKANKYLSACHDKTVSPAQRLANLRYIWAWSFVNV